MKNFLRSLVLFVIFLMLTAQQGCQTTSSLGGNKVSDKEQVKQKMIMEIQTEIKELGATPLTENEAKYEGALGKDKYIKALQEQLVELKLKKDKEASEAKAKEEKEKAEAKKKAEKEKKEKNRAKVIESVKKEILFLGETPLAEFEFTSEDKYIAALRKQIDEIKKLKEEEELKINAAIPEWYQSMPRGSETVMYARGSATSADLDNSEQRAIENALIKLSTQMQNRISSKTNLVIKEAGVDANLTLKTEMQRISNIVVKEATIKGYKIYKSKMAPISDGKYRTFIIIEFPVSLAYQNFINSLDESASIKAEINKLRETDAFKEIEQYVAEFSGA